MLEGDGALRAGESAKELLQLFRANQGSQFPREGSSLDEGVEEAEGIPESAPPRVTEFQGTPAVPMPGIAIRRSAVALHRNPHGKSSTTPLINPHKKTRHVHDVHPPQPCQFDPSKSESGQAECLPRPRAQ